MSDINVDVILPNLPITDVYLSGPQGPQGPQGPTGIVNTGELDFRYYSINNPSGFITGVDLTNYITGIDNILYTTGNQIKSGRLIIGDDAISIVDPNSPYTLSLQTNSPRTWLEILNNSGTNKGVFFGIEGNNFEQWNYQGGDIIFYTAENASDGSVRLTIKNDGKVGIGTSAPSEKLEVAGNLKVSNSGFFTNGIKVGNSSIIITENKIDGGYNASNGNLTDGLLGIQYSGYFSGDPEWFKTATLRPIINELVLTGVSSSGTYVRVGDQNNQGTNYLQGPNGWRINYYNQYPSAESYWYLHPENSVQHYISSDLETWGLAQNIQAWDGGSTYNINDIVSHGGSNWICKVYAPVGYGPFGGYLDGTANGTDYWDELPATQTSTVTQTQNFENSTNFSANRGLSNGTSWEWVGYFIPQVTEDYNFYLSADDDAYFWIGDKASNGYTTGNADIVNNSNVQNISLNSGQSYPVRLQWGHKPTPTNLGLSLGYQISNLGFYSYDFSGVFFQGTAGKGFYIDAISGDASFAGNIQSNTATFNNRPTVNGTGVLLSGEAANLPDTIVYTTGNQNISGNKNFAENVIVGDQTQEDLLVVSGNQISFGVIPTVSGNPLITGVDLSSYATVANLASTGSTLNNTIISLSGLFTGYTGALDATFASDIQLANTGSTLVTSINSLSGTLTGNYVTKNNGLFTNRPTVNGTNILLSGESIISGDLTGSLPYPTVNKLQGYQLDLNGGAADGQVLQWNAASSSWRAGAIPAGGNGGGGLVYYFDFANRSGIQPTGGLSTTGDYALSLLGRQYAVGSGQAISNELDPRFVDRLLCSFVTASGDPAVSNIPAGLWDFNIWASVNSPSATQCSIRAEVHIYNPTNSTYRYLASTDDVYLYETDTIAQYILNATVPQTGIANNERIYIKLFGKKYTTNNRNITIYFDPYRPSHVHTTIPSVAGNGAVKVVNGVFQSPATYIFDADVDNAANIAQSKIANLTGDLSTLTNNIASTGSTLNTKINNLSGVSVLTFGNQTINGLKTFTSGIDIYSGTLNIFNNTNMVGNLNLSGTGIFNAVDLSKISEFQFSGTDINLINSNVYLSGGANLYISGNKVLTGIDLSSYATSINLASTGSTLDTKINSLSGSSMLLYNNQTISGIKTFSNNINVSGTGVFNNFSLNGVDVLNLSGVNINITGTVALNLTPTVNGTGVLLSGQNSFIITLYNTSDTQGSGHNWFGNIAAAFSSTAGGVTRRFPVLESCVVKKATWTQYNQTIGSPSQNSTGYFINTTTNTTGIISTTINTQSTNTPTHYIVEFSPPIIISTGDYIVCSLFGPGYATTYPATVRNTVNLYCYN